MASHDVFLADCPARTTLGLVADTWSVVVVFGLGRGPQRYSDLRDRIGGISNKMLTQTLRKLERGNLVERRTIPAAPAGVEYRLTGLGESLLGPVSVLARWAEEHAAELGGGGDGGSL
ncbi:winged helix-turn-helix transcriptional regulator [Sphaerisporangium dianthi]|uniref:Winged helix-turn-helix transcriptional regulator n=1 Tax=Sphaerisporangium dianthi TaxID=1436120 RepID=A0ABV9CG10_9ACTN